MLVLTRKVNEAIVIGDGLATITVLSNDNRGLRLGIEAPKDVTVHRKEIFDKLQAEKESEDD